MNEEFIGVIKSRIVVLNLDYWRLVKNYWYWSGFFVGKRFVGGERMGKEGRNIRIGFGSWFLYLIYNF